MRVILVSDTHLGVKTEHFRANWAVTRDWIAERAPDLVINTGDMSLDGAELAEDLDFAVACHRHLSAPWLTLPGNHDVGDHPGISPRQIIDAERLARWRDRVGPDRWLRDAPGWRLIGLDALLIGSDLAEEAEQRAWLADAVATADGARLAVFLHKPFFIGPTLEESPIEPKLGYWTVDPARRGDYRFLFDHADLRLIASGHLHQYRLTTHRAARILWAPSVAFVVGDKLQENLGGLRQTGAVELDFGADAVDARFVRPAGLRDTVIDDIIDEIYPPMPASPATEG